MKVEPERACDCFCASRYVIYKGPETATQLKSESVNDQTAGEGTFASKKKINSRKVCKKELVPKNPADRRDHFVLVAEGIPCRVS